MGCDYYADEEGVFELEIFDADGQTLGKIHLGNLDPDQELYRQLTYGRDR